MKKCLAIVLFFIFHCHVISAQEPKSYKLGIIQTDSIKNKLLKRSSFNTLFQDTLSLRKELGKVLQHYYENGFLAATIDSIKNVNNTTVAFLKSGKQYKWARLSFIDIDPFVLHKTGINPKSFDKAPVEQKKFRNAQKKIINYYENTGYPFARLKINCVEFNNDSITGLLSLEKNKLYLIDSIHIKGNARISPFYLQKYLAIKPNNIYNESIISAIGNRLKELSFLKETKNYEVEFTDDKANIYLYLENKKSNQFNGILGVLPNDKTTGKVLITGEVNVLLFNSFSRGESVSFDWKKLEASSQELKAKLNYPFIFKLPLGVDIDFSLHQKDTAYLSANTVLGLQFLMQRGNYLKAYLENKNSSLISTKGLENITSIPPYADINIILYGIGYNDEHLDYKFNPRKGYSIKINACAGEKKIRKNAKVNPAVYNNIKLNSTQAEGTADISFFIPVFEKTAVMIQNKSGYIYNSTLFENELFKIGGLKTLRGFNENSFLVSSYSIMTAEYRLLFEQNSCLYVFFDGGYYEKNIISKFLSDFPIGFGAGIDFETKAGIFTVNFALGKQFDNPVEIRSAKIHFGYITRF
ncbi:MAG: BamA/TamA family outer membrane protein [Bacteroidia bacterium]|nr:BamA/TamA family outer membrane protein [Bacteroidia bacterium]